MDAPKRLTDRKRDAIVEAATNLFQTLGFDGASMDRVAETANVSKRTLYNHFPSKEELFAECCRRAWPVGGATLDAYRSDQPLRPQLTTFVEKKLAHFSDTKTHGLVRAALLSMLSSQERANDLLNRLGDLDRQTRLWVGGACADGRLRDCDPALATLQLEALMSGLALWPQITMRQARLSSEAQSQVSRSIVDMFLARYAPNELP